MYAISIYGSLEAKEGHVEELRGYLMEAAQQMKK